ncbi:hypothetical protein [Faecalibacillus intestinalis]|uniref:hypothetical protein n=1 Tax=Faecalibacillus intestinalis TaxID=1982626 RepID=UPI0039918BA7
MYDKGIEVNRLMEHSRKLISESFKVKEDELFLLAVVVKLIIWQLKVQPFNIKIG